MLNDVWGRTRVNYFKSHRQKLRTVYKYYSTCNGRTVEHYIPNVAVVVVLVPARAGIDARGMFFFVQLLFVACSRKSFEYFLLHYLCCERVMGTMILLLAANRKISETHVAYVACVCMCTHIRA